MPKDEFYHIIQTWHNLWLWLPMGDFASPPDLQAEYTEYFIKLATVPKPSDIQILTQAEAPVSSPYMDVRNSAPEFV